MCFFLLTDQKNVLAKESHQIRLDKDVLRLTVRLLTDEATKQVNAQLLSGAVALVVGL